MEEQVLTFTNPGTGQVFGQTHVVTSDEVRRIKAFRQLFYKES